MAGGHRRKKRRRETFQTTDTEVQAGDQTATPGRSKASSGKILLVSGHTDSALSQGEVVMDGQGHFLVVR